jgi:uncharacterized protein (DUF58 family)
MTIATHSMVGLGAIPLVLFLVIDLRKPLPMESEGRFTLTRKVRDKVFAGDPVLVELSIANSGEDIDRVYLEDEPPENSRILRGSKTLEGPLKKGAEITLRYELEFKEPGQFEFGITRLSNRSLFGLSEKSFIFYAPFGVRAYPRLLTTRLRPIHAPAFGWAGTTLSAYRGGRFEFMNIRGYVTGDRVRDVNWRATARSRNKLVNEWQVERGLDCVVIVDLFADDVPKVGDWSARGEIIDAACALANSFMTAGNRVGMLILGRILIKVKPGFGLRRLRAMVEAMIDSQEGDVWNVDHVLEYLEEFFRKQYVRRRGTLFFVSAGVNMRLVSAVESLSDRGFVCNTVVVNFLESEEKALTESKVLPRNEADLGQRFAKGELDWIEGQLASHSNVFEWSRDRGLVEYKSLIA